MYLFGKYGNSYYTIDAYRLDVVHRGNLIFGIRLTFHSFDTLIYLQHLSRNHGTP